ncbi:DUF3152 domain-containing protein [Streptosporangium sp. KLBMP 9127]|nr:DUF3152 domain-containing protein [Streptosporangium sp. KLBMP 9127]
MRRIVLLVCVLATGALLLLLRGTPPPSPPPAAGPPPPRATPAVSPSATPATARKERKERKERKVTRVPRSASGRFRVVSGTAPPGHGRGQVVRYLVEVERGLPFRPRAFAAAVHRILNDPRGWGHRFQRVDRPPARVRVALSSPALTDAQCLPLRTGGELSCWNGTRSVINAMRWAHGVKEYGGDLASYREYVVNHEVGHALGHGHESCPGPGRRAPVMAQQTKSLGGCRPNPWPNPDAPALTAGKVR